MNFVFTGLQRWLTTNCYSTKCLLYFQIPNYIIQILKHTQHNVYFLDRDQVGSELENFASHTDETAWPFRADYFKTCFNFEDFVTLTEDMFLTVSCLVSCRERYWSPLPRNCHEFRYYRRELNGKFISNIHYQRQLYHSLHKWAFCGRNTWGHFFKRLLYENWLPNRASTKGWIGRSCTIGLSTILTLIKTGFKFLGTGMEAKFRPFVDALTLWHGCYVP